MSIVLAQFLPVVGIVASLAVPPAAGLVIVPLALSGTRPQERAAILLAVAECIRALQPWARRDRYRKDRR